jgi:hypothetical protein
LEFINLIAARKKDGFFLNKGCNKYLDSQWKAIMSSLEVKILGLDCNQSKLMFLLI